MPRHGPIAWRSATPNEVAAAVFPSQLPPRSVEAAPCAFPFKHGCLGVCRTSSNAVSRETSAMIAVSDAGADPLAGLRSVFDHVRHPRCALSFVGDSVSHDTFGAALLGALRLGRRLSYCSNSPLHAGATVP